MLQFGPAWLFDDTPIADPFGYGARALRFVDILKHPKSCLPDRRLSIDLWQSRIIQRIYGGCDDAGQRTVRVVFIQLGRGNRKTSLGAILALVHTFSPERIQGGQVISAAADRKQARIA